MTEGRPNLLFVFSDQHRACDLGCYGNSEVASPTFDRLAEEGARLRTCVANSPVCVPMRGSLLTGLHAWNHRALSNDLPIRTDVESAADVLRVGGYRTGYIGKWHLGGVPRDRAIKTDERLGFQEWKVANCTHDYSNSYYYDEDDVRHEYDQFEPIGQTDLALDFIRRAAQAGDAQAGDANPEKQPWALFLSWGPPHAPYHDVPEEYRALFEAESITLRPNVAETSWDGTERSTVREWLAGYYAHIKLLDEQLSRLLSLLDDLDLAESTIVAYTSDHGDMLGSHGMTKKQLPYDESVRVPFLLRWPGRVPPGPRGGVFGLVDVAPTLVGLCGLSFAPEVDGIDLSPAFVSADGAGRDAALIYNLVPCHQAADRGDPGGWVGVRTERHTYARWDFEECLCAFDDQTDPYQRLNFCADRGGVSGGAEAEPDPAGELDRKTDAELAAVGYRFRRWQEMLIEDGFVEEWNESQRYFGRPELENADSPA